ncbi:hypothetical protein COLO4_27430 [Corchorus olitorius]|uniref:HAT C-terminal dimerisation domain-containing protein n=1 Tax=Corchorus olitorius TaxID=93759 RepID=A0A1R3HR24_9ROSI|nr:hypothetical protein COLO4_27430 [Corchorus olitorius]
MSSTFGGSRYSKVAAMTRDILSVPISTMASESTFSIGAKVLDQYQSSLKQDVVEAIICSKDWLFQEINTEETTLGDLTQDVMNLSLTKVPSGQSSSQGLMLQQFEKVFVFFVENVAVLL